MDQLSDSSASVSGFVNIVLLEHPFMNRAHTDRWTIPPGQCNITHVENCYQGASSDSFDFSILHWPPESQDMNIIEHMFQYVEHIRPKNPRVLENHGKL
ncbi:hypothetical protein TNCV_1416731 [Trichonephila clavipes]|nr:hypothetical protein TNCV_1416731 [Trichonephila clavipes]